MSYRHSSYEPLAAEVPGRPLRPYNMAQWLGVVMTAAGLALGHAHIAARLGWLPSLLDSAAIPFWLVILGSFLVGCRREPGRLQTPSEVRRGYRLFAATLAIGAVLAVALFLLLERAS
jgi:hypothetical protein